MVWRTNPASFRPRLLRTSCSPVIFSILFIFITISAMTADGETRKVTDKDDGASVSLQVGQTLEICLPAVMGTGYSWAVSSPPNEILKPLSNDLQPPTEKDKVGATEYQIFRFQTVARGAAHLELLYKRPWDKTPASGKKYSLSIRVE